MKTSYYISPGFTNIKFLTFNLDNPKNGDWNQAVEVFKNRFNSRFFIPITHLIKGSEIVMSEGDEKDVFHPGFITLSIDCTLLETLNQFKHGINDSTVCFHNSCSFSLILMGTPKLSQYFPTKEDAGHFYNDVRCGLVHQGQTKGNSKLNKNQNFIVNHYKNGGLGFDVNRTMFHEFVVEEYDKYMSCLLDVNNKVYDNMRENFRDKMHFLCGQNLPQKKEKKCRFCGNKI